MAGACNANANVGGAGGGGYGTVDLGGGGGGGPPRTPFMLSDLYMPGAIGGGAKTGGEGNFFVTGGTKDDILLPSMACRTPGQGGAGGTIPVNLGIKSMFYGIPGGAGGLGSPYKLVGGGGSPIFSFLNIPGATIIGPIKLSGGFGGKGPSKKPSDESFLFLFIFCI